MRLRYDMMTKGQLEEQRQIALSDQDQTTLNAIDFELDRNPPTRYSKDWEVCVIYLDRTHDLIWASGQTASEAAAKAVARAMKAGKNVMGAQVLQMLPAPRWD